MFELRNIPHLSVFQAEETHLPAAFVTGIKLFQENVCHVFLPITNICFVAFENSSEGSLPKAFTLTEKINTETTKFLHHKKHFTFGGPFMLVLVQYQCSCICHLVVHICNSDVISWATVVIV